MQTMMWQRVKTHTPKNNKSIQGIQGIQGLLDAMRNVDLKR